MPFPKQMASDYVTMRRTSASIIKMVEDHMAQSGPVMIYTHFCPHTIWTSDNTTGLGRVEGPMGTYYLGRGQRLDPNKLNCVTCHAEKRGFKQIYKPKL
ncbi:hypothetical protein C1H76_5689 [Elsinoe australis]|uniref:Uncharacterized protein n=1 Tax=Elsinoe australis TaxID=40998 RepID=A0A4U7B026_9PEZI|nr:hypothetical protein C1H76_5689 [Elsinoe australis]